MKIRSFVAAATIGLFMLFAQAAAAEAADVKVLHTGAFTSVMNELGPQFERATGHKLVTGMQAGGVLKREINAGETFDVAILPTPLIAELVKAGKIAADMGTVVAHASVGVGVRAGAFKPDISSVETIKGTLLSAKSVAYNKEGTSGAHFASLLQRLGIAKEMEPKLRPKGGGDAAPAVARGEAEMVVVAIPGIVAASGVIFVGPLPAELQTYISLSVGLSAASKQADAAKALIKHLTAPAAAAVIKAKGFEPAAP